jgi:Bacterial Ig-like domain (group 3)/FG-GAP-like repeat
MKRKNNFLSESLERRTLFSTGSISFAPRVDFVAGTLPWALVAGDFNSDGNQDLAVADRSLRQVNIFFGNGKGAFSTGPSLALSAVPTAIVTGDFNGDGLPDLAVASSPRQGQTGSTVTIFLNQGAGTFGLGQITTVIPGAGAGDTVMLGTGDFNKDGFLDVAVTDFNAQTLSILNGTGAGTFASPRTVSLNSNPTAIAVADFNNDGNLDLAVTTTVANAVFSSGAVTIWTGNSNGVFTAGNSLAINTNGMPTSIATANLSGKDSLGLVIGNSDATVVVLTNKNGRFSLASRAFTVAGVGTVAASDLNVNGAVDFVTANAGASGGNSSNSITVVPGNGSGKISKPISFAAGASPSDVAIADFNNDGRPDVATANSGGGTVSILINTSQVPQVSTKTVVTAPTSSTPGGSDLMLTATITGSKASVLPGVIYPTGTVNFFDGSTLIGSATIGVNSNQAVFTTNSLIVGVHQLSAVYKGDDAFTGSQSAKITQTITPTATDGPDLVGTFVSTTFADLIAPGQTCAVTIKITNQGNSPAIGALTNAMYLSADGIVDPSDIVLTIKGALGKSNIRLNAGKSQTLKGNVVVPSNAALGSYFLLTELNTTGTILEYDMNDAVPSPTQHTVAHVFGTLGSNHNVPLQLADLNGTLGTFKLSGPGMGTVNVGSSSIDLTLSGTTTSTTLTITSKGASFQLNTLSDIAPIRTISAASVAVNHLLTLAASAASITLATFGTSAADAITLGTGAQTTITLGTVLGGTLDSTNGIKSLSVSSWGAGEIVAPLIGTLRSKGDFNPQLSLSDTGTSLKSVNITGSVAGDWQAAGSIGSITIRGNLTSAKLIADANFNSLTISGSVDTSQILAALNAPGIFGTLRVSGQFTNSLLGTGATPSDTPSGLPATALRDDGTIRSITVTGAVDAQSRFLAATEPKQAKLGGITVTPASDPRFQI